MVDAYSQTSEATKEAVADWLLRKAHAGSGRYPALPEKYMTAKFRKRELSIEECIGDLKPVDDVMAVCRDKRLILAIERAALTEDERQAVAYYHKGFTYREMAADIGGVCPKTCWNRFHSAKAKIRRELDSDPWWPTQDVLWAEHVIPRLLSAVSVIYWHLREQDAGRY